MPNHEENMKKYGITEFSKKTGSSQTTIRRLDKSGEFVAKRDSKNKRYYTDDDIVLFKNLLSARKNSRSLSCQDKDWLYEQYVVNNKTIKEIAELGGSGISVVSRWVNEFELKRTMSGASDIVKNKKKKFEETCESKYGVKNVMQSFEIKQKQENTMLERYGVSRPLQRQEFLDKFEETCLNKFGHKTPLQNESIRQKSKDTLMAKHGFENPMQIKKFREKAEETNLKKYGTRFPAQNQEIKEKSIQAYNNSNGVYYLEKYWSKRNLADEFNVSLYYLGHWLRSQKNLNEEAIKNWIESYDGSLTNIEEIFSKNYKIKKWDKKFDKKKYPSLNYRPDFKLSDKIALNTDGLYWHSESNVSKKYHYNMRKDYEELGLQVIQFYSDEIENKTEIVKSMADAKLGIFSNRIFGRKTQLKSLSKVDARAFFQKNHIMAAGPNAKYIGLYFNESLVSAMSYRNLKNGLKIDRFCSSLGTQVIGGFGKLFSFIKKNESYKRIDYWVDLRYGTGTFLEKFGFTICRETLGWKWTDNFKSYNRLKCRANMDSRNLSQAEHAKELKLTKIFDAGQRLWQLTLPHEVK